MKESVWRRMKITGFLLAMESGAVTLWDLQQPFVLQPMQSGPAVRGGGQ